MTLVAVAPTKYSKGIDASGREVREAYEVLDLAAALTRVYVTDAHLVSYVLPGRTRQPRINKGGLPFAPEMPEVGVFFCDIDNAEHAEWTPELMESAQREDESLPILAAAGVYYTAHGRRIVQPIAAAIPVSQVEPYLCRWLRDLETAGIVVDWACRDWTRHFRLPHVRRDGRSYRSPLVALDRMTPIALAPLPELAAASSATNAPPTPRPIPVVDWTRDLPSSWHGKVAQIAEAVRAVPTDWHTLFLTLAGALLARGAPPEHLPALCRAISLATNADTRTHDREAIGRTTAERKLSGQPVKGHAELRRRYAGVADAVDGAFATGAKARARAQAREAAEGPPPRPLAETTAALERAIRDAPDGVTLISAECGLGKTQAAIRVAVERAKKPHATGSGTRAPAQSKTSISVDKNELAIQIADYVRETGTPVKRLFGPLSMLREDKTPECRYHAVATPLVEGGQSLRLVLCEGRGGPRCEHYARCRAREGFEGDADARIVVAPHALLSVASAEAGKTGLLVIDEPPMLLQNLSFTLAEIDATLAARSMFAVRYAAAMTPALRSIRAWVEGAFDLERVVSLKDAVREAAASVDAMDLAAARIAAGVPPSGAVADDVLACVANALGKSPRSMAPPIQNAYLYAARRDLALARKLGAASKVLNAVRFALTTDERVAARVEDGGKERALMLTHARKDLTEAVKREGATVLLDASADLHAPILEKVVEYKPRVERFTAVDGAPIERTLLQTPNATRRNWFVNGRLVIESSVVDALGRVFAWVAEDPTAKALGLVTFRPLALGLHTAIAGEPISDDTRAAWEKAGQRPGDLDEVCARLSRVLAQWPGAVHVGHYGAVRGLDAMKNVDAMATLGDPWPNLGIVEHDVAFLGLADPWERRLKGLCRAELEQAHGRLRVVHRTRPARALHVGNVLPGGSGWCEGRVAYRPIVGGRPRTEAAMTRDEARAAVDALGGIRATARVLGCGRSAVCRYVNGERAVPSALAVELRRLAEAATGVADAAAE